MKTHLHFLSKNFLLWIIPFKRKWILTGRPLKIKYKHALMSIHTTYNSRIHMNIKEETAPIKNSQIIFSR